jgi:large subunit ribosomal protein L4
MSKLAVKSVAGEQVGDYEVADDLLVFDKGHQAVYEAVVAYQANQRAGTASTLTKAGVAGSGGKPWKQKGTGRARAGYQTSPVWRGGGVAFGPKPRSFEKRLTKKEARLAFRRALSDKIAAGQVVVLDDVALDAPKTKTVAGWLKQLGVTGGVLLVTDEAQATLRLSVRNMANVALTTAAHVNVYELLRYPTLLVTRKGMDVLTERLQPAGGRKA